MPRSSCSVSIDGNRPEVRVLQSLSIPVLTPEVSLLALLLSGHVLGDFLAQTPWLSGRKAEKTWWMVVHGLIVMLTHLVLLSSFWSRPVVLAAVALAVAHFVIDISNRAFARAHGLSLPQFLVDQALHVASIVVAWHLLAVALDSGEVVLHSGRWASIMGLACLVFSGFILNTRGGTIAISRVFLEHPELLPEQRGADPLQLGWGRTAGHLERSLFYVLVLLGQWVALGLVVAAKAWRGGPPIKDCREEYYRSIGFLASILVAVVTGVMIRLILAA